MTGLIDRVQGECGGRVENAEAKYPEVGLEVEQFLRERIPAHELLRSGVVVVTGVNGVTLVKAAFSQYPSSSSGSQPEVADAPSQQPSSH